MTIHSLLNLPKQARAAIAWLCSKEKLEFVQTPTKSIKVSVIRKLFQSETLDELPPQKIKALSIVKWLFSGETLEEIPEEAQKRDSFFRWLCKSESLDGGSKDPSSRSKQHVEKE